MSRRKWERVINWNESHVKNFEVVTSFAIINSITWFQVYVVPCTSYKYIYIYSPTNKASSWGGICNQNPSYNLKCRIYCKINERASFSCKCDFSKCSKIFRDVLPAKGSFCKLHFSISSSFSLSMRLPSFTNSLPLLQFRFFILLPSSLFTTTTDSRRLNGRAMLRYFHRQETEKRLDDGEIRQTRSGKLLFYIRAHLVPKALFSSLQESER